MTPRRTPRVSICVPNLNTRPFLPERFATILGQTYGDWELLVYDSYSTDGAWEYIQALAAREPRVRAWQGPREGTPGSWTPCVRAARGEYVYVATSDDTMPPDCLEKLVGALDAHPDCDVAHCPLRAIDGAGRNLTHITDAWWRESPFALSSGPLLHREHVRRAPLDGLLHLLGDSMYISITQLLIRRSLFDRIGYFERRWGSVGDFNWSMRAGLVANTVHVPDTWGGWRVHTTQATAGVTFSSPEHVLKVERMIEDALAACTPHLPSSVRSRLESLSEDAKQFRTFMRTVAARAHHPAGTRYTFLAHQVLAGSRPAREYVKARLLRRPWLDWLRHAVVDTDAAPVLVPAAGRAGGIPR